MVFLYSKVKYINRMTIDYSLLKTKQKSDLMVLFGKNIPTGVCYFSLIITLFICCRNTLLAFLDITKENLGSFLFETVVFFIVSLIVSIIVIDLASEWTDKPYSKKDRDDEVLYVYTPMEIIIPLIIQVCTVAISFLFAFFLNPFILLAYIPFIIWLAYLYHRTWIKKCEAYATI